MYIHAHVKNKIDLLLGFIASGQPALIAGPSGFGKTALALELARAANLRPVLFEAVGDRDVAPDEIVLIEAFEDLPAELQHDLINMLRTPVEITSTPRMERLRGKPLVIMSRKAPEQGPSNHRSSQYDTYSDPAAPLRDLLPVVEVSYVADLWVAWAAQNDLPLAAVVFGATSPEFFESDKGEPAMSLRTLAKIGSILKGSSGDLSDLKTLQAVQSHLPDHLAFEVPEALRAIEKNIQRLGLDASGNLPRDMPPISDIPQGLRFLLVCALGMAATDKTLERYVDYIHPIRDLFETLLLIVNAHEKCSKKVVIETFTQDKYQYSFLSR